MFEEEREEIERMIEALDEPITPEERLSGTKRTEKESVFRSIAETLLYFGVIFLLVYLVTTYVGQRTMVSGSSMYDTLEDGDQLLIDKLSYLIGDPERFDIVVFRYLGEENTYYIKRIIGLPGETVQIINGVIYIDGVALEEDYGYGEILRAGIASEPITLGEDEYFVLGDNRNNSKDSRSADVGNVSRSQILGKAFLRIWPPTSITFLD